MQVFTPCEHGNRKIICPTCAKRKIHRTWSLLRDKLTTVNGYEIIHQPDLVALEREFGEAWKDDKIPAKQASRLDLHHPMFALIVNFLRMIDSTDQTMLEIGCSTGFVGEVLAAANVHVHYSGCDLSPAFIRYAQSEYPAPDGTFFVADARSIPVRDRSYDIVLAGGVILHVIDYAKAIREAIRISSKYVIFHRMPMVHMRKTTYTKKKGYGVPMIEVVFNEEELFDIFRENGICVLAVNTHAETNCGLGELVYHKSYLCKRL